MKTLYLLMLVSALLCAQHTTPDGKVFSLYENPATGRLNIKIKQGTTMALVHMPDELADTHHPNQIARFARDEFLWCVSGQDLIVLLKDEKANREHIYFIDCSDLNAVSSKKAPTFFHKQFTMSPEEMAQYLEEHPEVAEQSRRCSTDFTPMYYSDLKKEASPARKINDVLAHMYSFIITQVKTSR